MKKLQKSLKILICLALVCTISLTHSVSAAENTEYGISMSPLNQKIILTPGETYTGSFDIFNPASHTTDFKYTVTTEPFYVDESYNPIFDNPQSYNQIVDWTTVDVESGKVSPNEKQTIVFTINAPENAPAGGQYMAITVTSDEESESEENSTMIVAKQAMAHALFAEIAGTTERSGNVQSAKVPGFLFGGKISGNSTIQNTGNVHGTATYKLQAFPLFSNEEVYTNEEKPEEKTILPDRSLYNVTSWEETPSAGIFNVVYTAEFEGVTTQVKKMVIVCPAWLLIAIIVAIIIIAAWLYSKSKKRKNSKK